MIADLHNDILVKKEQFYRGNKNAVVGAVWTSKMDNPLEFLKRAKDMAKYRAIEDLGFIRRTDFPAIADFAPLYASLTWNETNALAGGAFSDGHLTNRGREVIDFLVMNRISIDSAHLNERSFFEVSEYLYTISTNILYPLICSHTCFDGIFKHKRNLKDGQIKTIIDFNGIIGLTLVPEFMGNKNADKDDVIRQIEYFLEKFGHENLGIGTDFFGADRLAIASYRELEKLKNRLVKTGLCEKKMTAIFYGNAARFLNGR